MAGRSKSNSIYANNVAIVYGGVADIYNKHYPYVWRTNTYALPSWTVDILRETCEGKWGYYFDPTGEPIESRSDKHHSYMHNVMCLTFELEEDMVQAKLSLSFKN